MAWSNNVLLFVPSPLFYMQIHVYLDPTNSISTASVNFSAACGNLGTRKIYNSKDITYLNARSRTIVYGLY